MTYNVKRETADVRCEMDSGRQGRLTIHVLS